MTLIQFQTLLSAVGQSALAAATAITPSDATFLACYEKLRKTFDADLAKVALETAILRTKAAGKFPDASVMFFTKESLEQSTSHVVAMHRAKRFSQFRTVLDLGCGIGGDAIALARAGCRVIAYENVPVRAAMAAANLAALGLSGEIRGADVLTEPLPEVDAVFCDPARRTGDRRYLSVNDYIPSPRAILELFGTNVPIAFKLAPGVPWNDLEDYDAEIEFVSLQGELKECVLWHGQLKAVKRRATLLPAGDTLTADDPASEPPMGEMGEFVYDPDPAVERAKLVGNLAELIDAASLDDAPAFLTSTVPVTTPFAEVYKVAESLKYDRKKLNAVLRRHDIGRVTLLRKNTPENAESVLKGLKLEGAGHCHVILTRVGGLSSAIIANSES